MADSQRIARVRKGPYNQYLRKENPLDYAPLTSRRFLEEKNYVSRESGTDNCPVAPMTESEEASTSIADEENSLNSGEEDQDFITENVSSPEFYQEPNRDQISDHEFYQEPNIDQIEVNDFNFDVCQKIYEMNHGLINIENNMSEEEENISGNVFDQAIREHGMDIPVPDNSTLHSDSPAEDELIYEGASLTLGVSMLLIITFSIKYSLTGEALADMLKLIQLHCLPVNNLPGTLYMFKKWFQDIKHPLHFHKICNNCQLLLSTSDLDKGTCPNPRCHHDIGSVNEVDSFIEIPIAEQIASLFARPSFCKNIQHRFNRKKHADDAIEDIYDGKIYKSLSQEGGVLHCPYNLSLLWNTDGIPAFKSSKMSLWPMFFQVNELPYQDRIKQENLILGGLWYSSTKPSVLSYTKPIKDALVELEKGLQVDTPMYGKIITRVFVIGGTADLPARSLMCNTIQYNGKYGCVKCLQPGETYKTSNSGNVHVFPFSQDSPTGPERTHEANLHDMEMATNSGETKNGIKGPCFMKALMYFDLVSGICIDYMHGVLLGVTKLLLKLWFSSEFSQELFSMSQSVELVDNRLIKLKPPNNIARPPRSIQDHRKYWKASELKSWLLYYSLPILKDIQREDYYQHYLLFVEAVYLLLQDSISPEDVAKAERLFQHFCCMFAAFYGDRYMTCNIHQLLHLPANVTDMGPLWAYSCFPFENANGTLLKLFHGTQHVDMQIANSVGILQKLPNVDQSLLHVGSLESDFYLSLKGVPNRDDKHLHDNIYAVGACTKRDLQDYQLNAVSGYLGHMPIHHLSFSRLRIGKEYFHSRLYTRCYARNSFTVAYNSDCGSIQFGSVEFYLQLFPYCRQHNNSSYICGCDPVNVALISRMKPVESVEKLARDVTTNARVGHIHILSPAEFGDVCVVPLQNLLYKCVCVEVYDRPGVVYACKMPNCCERE